MVTKRRPNPGPGSEFKGGKSRAPKARKRRQRKKGELTKRERRAIIKELNYKERAKKMRPYFGDTFKASEGFDLRRPKTWTPAQKAKVTKYYRVMAPRLSHDFEVKRYRRPDKLENAIDASLQEHPLPGQTAALFSYDPGEQVEIVTEGDEVRVVRQGLDRGKIKFDRNAFLEDPEAEIQRALDATNANVFRILVGGNEQNKALTREDVMGEIFAMIDRYSVENVEEGERPWQEWLNGLVAYGGPKKRTKSRLSRQIEKHKKLSEQRDKERLATLSKRSRARTRRELIKGRK